MRNIERSVILQNVRLRGMRHDKWGWVLLDILVFASKLPECQITPVYFALRMYEKTHAFQGCLGRHLVATGVDRRFVLETGIKLFKEQETGPA